MTVIGIDDTDSREFGMCTTYVAHRLASEIETAGGSVARTLLVRLNPAVEYKTRGNAALAIHTDTEAERALELGTDRLALAETGDDRTNPGLVVADGPPAAIPEDIAAFSRRALREHLAIDEARDRSRSAGFRTAAKGNGRGLVGALAAVGAWRAFEEWTYECLSYREQSRWGTARAVDADSVFAAAEAGYPAVWDTADRVEAVPVCVPRTPCPVLHGIRGEDPDAVRAVADRIEGEPTPERRVFVTNQGTDAHLQSAPLAEVADGRSYRVDAVVRESPETRPGGHVFLTLEGPESNSLDGNSPDTFEGERSSNANLAGERPGGASSGEFGPTLQAAAFEPTKRFRDRVRGLRAGDRITACGEVTDGTLKLEKFAVRDLVRTEWVTPDCPDCDRSMSSAGSDAGYRCRRCGNHEEGLVERPLDRDLERGWYEVPPCARRHVAKPLIRGGFDAPTHPER